MESRGHQCGKSTGGVSWAPPALVVKAAAPTARTRVFRGAESFVDVVLMRLRSRFGDDLATLGATVVTTLDPEVQRAASRGVRARRDTRRRAPATEVAHVMRGGDSLEMMTRW